MFMIYGYWVGVFWCMKLMILVPKELIRIIRIVELLKATVAIGTCFRSSLQWSHCEVPFISSYILSFPSPRFWRPATLAGGVVDGVEDEIEVENDELKASMMVRWAEIKTLVGWFYIQNSPTLHIETTNLALTGHCLQGPIQTNQMDEMLQIVFAASAVQMAQSWWHLLGESETDGGGC